MSSMSTAANTDIERVFHEQYGHAVAVLVRVFDDIDVAEEAVQDAFTTALERWPSTGVPPNPAGWMARAYEAAVARADNAVERRFLECRLRMLTPT